MWPAILVASLGCYAWKLAGLSVPPRVLRDPATQRIAGLLPIALLAALVATQTFGDGRALRLDARAVGLAVAVVAAWRRAPFLVVVAAAAAATAAVRAL